MHHACRSSSACALAGAGSCLGVRSVALSGQNDGRCAQRFRSVGRKTFSGTNMALKTMKTMIPVESGGGAAPVLLVGRRLSAAGKLVTIPVIALRSRYSEILPSCPLWFPVRHSAYLISHFFRGRPCFPWLRMRVRIACGIIVNFDCADGSRVMAITLTQGSSVADEPPDGTPWG